MKPEDIKPGMRVVWRGAEVTLWCSDGPGQYLVSDLCLATFHAYVERVPHVLDAEEARTLGRWADDGGHVEGA